jgi:hypothetical protein
MLGLCANNIDANAPEGVLVSPWTLLLRFHGIAPALTAQAMIVRELYILSICIGFFEAGRQLT